MVNWPLKIDSFDNLSMYSRLQVTCNSEYSEILMAEIAEAGFDTFMETETGFEAYVEGNSFDKQLLQEIKEKYAHVSPLVFQFDEIEKQNWNEQWEKNVEPIIVDDKCLVRADFNKIDQTYPSSNHPFNVERTNENGSSWQAGNGCRMRYGYTFGNGQ